MTDKILSEIDKSDFLFNVFFMCMFAVWIGAAFLWAICVFLFGLVLSIQLFLLVTG